MEPGEVRIFSSTGRHLRTLGGRGEGPGEFRILSPLAGLVEDTIWTWDRRLSRITWFSTDGDVLGNMHVPVNAGVDDLARLSDGTHLAKMAFNPELKDGSYLAPGSIWKLDSAGNVRDSLQNVGGHDLQVTRNADGAVTGILLPPFGRFPVVATGADDRIFTGWNGVYAVVVRSLAGDPVMVLSAPGLERRIDPAEVRSTRERWLERCSDEQCQRNINRMFDELQLPDRRPAFSALRADPLGNLWVAEYDPTGNVVVGWQGSGWHVFSGDGELLGRVAVPPGIRLYEIGANYVMGVRDNELGVPFVVRLPLSR